MAGQGGGLVIEGAGERVDGRGKRELQQVVWGHRQRSHAPPTPSHSHCHSHCHSHNAFAVPQRRHTLAWPARLPTTRGTNGAPGPGNRTYSGKRAALAACDQAKSSTVH